MVINLLNKYFLFHVLFLLINPLTKIKFITENYNIIECLNLSSLKVSSLFYYFLALYQVHLTAFSSCPLANSFLSSSLAVMILMGMMFSIPLVLQILLLSSSM